MSTSPAEGLWVELTCDGNRRSLVEQLEQQEDSIPSTENLPPEALYECYRLGGEATKKIIEVSRDSYVGLIAPWTWSTKNWSRPVEHAKAVFRVTTEFLHDLQTRWIDLPENSDVRMVHMGREKRLLQEAPEMMKLLTDICAHTRDRTGMVVALLMDYSGPDEEERARESWRTKGFKGIYQQHLDLPRQGIAYKELDLRIRTGESTRIKHINAVMRGYEGMETREIFRDEYLPNYTPNLYRADLLEFMQTEKRQGK